MFPLNNSGHYITYIYIYTYYQPNLHALFFPGKPLKFTIPMLYQVWSPKVKDPFLHSPWFFSKGLREPHAPANRIPHESPNQPQMIQESRNINCCVLGTPQKISIEPFQMMVWFRWCSFSSRPIFSGSSRSSFSGCMFQWYVTFRTPQGRTEKRIP